MELICVSIAFQCATNGALLDQHARIQMEQSIESAQKNRSFGPSAYCLPSDSLSHCPGLSTSNVDYPTRDLHRGMPDTILEPLKHVLGMR